MTETPYLRPADKNVVVFPLVSCTNILTCGCYKVIATCSWYSHFFCNNNNKQKRYISASKSW